jgi:hypothetical protein
MRDDLMPVMNAVRQRLTASAIDDAPFPHLVVNDCFPWEYYHHLVADWPALEEFADVGGGYVFGLYYQPFPGMDGILAERGLMRADRVQHHARWQDFRAVIEHAVIPVVLQKFQQPIRAMMRRRFLRLRPRLSVRDFEILSDMLIVRKNRHDLAAHLDDLRSLIQILIYLPTDDARPHLGTQLFEQVGEGVRKEPAELSHCRLAQYAVSLGIEVHEAKRIPFNRNTLVATLNHPRSWHGQLLDEPYERRGYQGFIGVRSKFLSAFFDDESVAKLVAAS